MLIDLHTHSTASDGQYTPTELCAIIHDCGIEIWSLTDHDTVNGINEAIKTAERYSVSFIPGIEISAQDIVEVHILGYGIDHRNKKLISKCSEFQADRHDRGRRIRDYLLSKDVDVDIDEVFRFAGGEVIGRPHFARYLVEHGIVENRNEAFDRYLDTEEFKRSTDRKKPTPEETIDIIHEAGGLAVLAHPGNYKVDSNTLEHILNRLCSYGLDGLECYYSRYTPSQIDEYLSLAHRYGFIITGGSDYHGERVKPDINPGMEIDDNIVDWIVL